MSSIRFFITKCKINNDRYLNHSKAGAWMIAGYMIAIMFLVWVVLVWLEYYLLKSADWRLYLFTILKINTPPSSLSGDVSGAYHWMAYLIMGIVATLLIPFLTAAVTNGVKQRTDKVRFGRKTYSLSMHYVLIGYNRYAPQILRRVLCCNKAYAIIMTTQDPIRLREVLDNELNKTIAKRVVIYAGDALQPENISRLNLPKAQQLYLLDESEPHASQYARNITVLKHITNAVANKETPMEVYMQVNNAKAYNLLQRIDIPAEFFRRNGKQNVAIDFRPFNFYENWARLLWSYHVLRDDAGQPVYDPLDFEPLEGTDKHVHLVISSFNSMGRALMLEALRLCHYTNFDERTGKNKTVITVFDAKCDSLAERFLAQYPNINEIIDVTIDFRAQNINDPAARELIDEWARDEKQLLTITICEKDPDSAITTALNLPEAVYYQKEHFTAGEMGSAINSSRTRVLVRQEQEELNDVFDQTNKIAYPHVEIFGMLKQGCDESLIDDYLPICVDAIYETISKEYKRINVWNLDELNQIREKFQNAFINNMAPVRIKWRNKQESTKWSNRYQVDMFRYYLAMYNRHKDQDLAQTEQLLRCLAEVEHHRWCAERIVSGWRSSDNDVLDIKDGKQQNKNQYKRIHTLLVPYADLTGELEKEQIKDYNVVATIPLIVSMAPEYKNA